MYFADFSPKYLLLSADYAENEGLSLHEKSKIVIERYRNEIIEYCQKTEKNTPIAGANSYYNFILWRNAPKTNIADNTEDNLFSTICQSMTPYKESGIFDIYIRNKEVLADQSLERFVKRMCQIRASIMKKPIFLDNTVDALLNPSLDKKDENAILKLTIENELAYDQYYRMMEFLENIYTSITGDSIKNEDKGFIYYYFEWQKGTFSTTAACKEGNMSRRTFYNYIDEFEKHPYYPEFCKAYFTELINKEKKGPITFDLDEYYKETEHFFNKDYIDINYLDQLEIDELCEKYSIVSTLDAYRYFLAVKKKLKIK